jgi:hypothetical protein
MSLLQKDPVLAGVYIWLHHVREHILRTPKLDLPDSQDVRGASVPKRCFRVAHPSDGVEEGEGVVIPKLTAFVGPYFPCL